MLEWDRRYLTVLGVAGKRLYELRLQVRSAAGRAVAGWAVASGWVGKRLYELRLQVGRLWLLRCRLIMRVATRSFGGWVGSCWAVRAGRPCCCR